PIPVEATAASAATAVSAAMVPARAAKTARRQCRAPKTRAKAASTRPLAPMAIRNVSAEASDPTRPGSAASLVTSRRARTRRPPTMRLAPSSSSATSVRATSASVTARAGTACRPQRGGGERSPELVNVRAQELVVDGAHAVHDLGRQGWHLARQQVRSDLANRRGARDHRAHRVEHQRVAERLLRQSLTAEERGVLLVDQPHAKVEVDPGERLTTVELLSLAVVRAMIIRAERRRTIHLATEQAAR